MRATGETFGWHRKMIYGKAYHMGAFGLTGFGWHRKMIYGKAVRSPRARESRLAGIEK